LPELTSLKRYDVIAAWEEKEWRDFLNKWIANAHHVSVLGVPSAKLSDKLKADEKARVDEQIVKIGPDGLRELEKKLAAAKAANEVDVPQGLLEKFAIPSMDSIHFINTTTARSGLARQKVDLENPAQKVISGDSADVPLFIHFEDVETAFVHINLVISIEQVPVPKRPLLAIYMESFFSLPVRRNGEVIKFDRVVTELERDTAFYSIGTGEGISNAEVLQIDLRVEPDKYHAAVQWLNQLLWGSVFDVEVSHI
jgi:Zn-dependent M16 (insulinase) family peptidase